MRSRDLSFTIALCASLVVHAAISLTVAESYVRQFGRQIRLPAPTRAAVNEPMTPQMAMFRYDSDPFRRLGEPHGAGTAIDSSPGDQPMLAAQGIQDQAFLSRDPAGPGKVGDPPTESLVRLGEGAPATAAGPPVSAFTAPSQDRPMVGIQSSQQISPLVKSEPSEDRDAGRADSSESVAPGNVSAPSATVPLASTPPASASPTAAPPENAPSAAVPPASVPPESRIATPGPQSAADPAPQAESESDPIASIGSVEFRRGSTVARLGRKHRLTRPRWTLDANVDLLTLGSTWLELKLRTDPTGNVISAEISRSSGSRTIDQLCKVAAYEWWFEPPRSAAGQAIADAFHFTVRIN